MEESNIVGLTFKQRVDAANATGWTKQSAPNNGNAIACVCIVTVIVLGLLVFVKVINK